MKRKNQRKKFLIHKPFQLRYLLYIILLLAIFSAVGMIGSYYGNWASVIKAFSDSEIRNAVTTAAQLHEYEEVRRPSPKSEGVSLRSFRETELLSQRDREVIRNIMTQTNRRIVALGILLILLIGWGSIYLTHKVAGPVFRVNQSLREIHNGNLAIRIRFRKFDESQGLSARFNEMAASLDRSVGGMKRALREIPPSQATEALQKELDRFRTTSG
ncbi:MAG: hypothetical protein A3A73_05435 [Omnitrophica bacterium RIFCSPLOWO2_01_FULL_50_24]|nr:MAG: hypothetical protein A3A73_05435 [Omnitrophica bacterium RIFCSPLOWO2_01_FULL_50_24]